MWKRLVLVGVGAFLAGVVIGVLGAVFLPSETRRMEAEIRRIQASRLLRALEPGNPFLPRESAIDQLRRNMATTSDYAP